MKMGKAADPRRGRAAMLAALGRKRDGGPGGFAKLLTYSLAMHAAAPLASDLGSVMGGMTRHQHDQTRPAPRPA
jgi:hypothetical protein